MRSRLGSTPKRRPFSTKNCAFEVRNRIVIRSAKKTRRGPSPHLKVEVFRAYGGRKQDGGEIFTRLTALASKGSADFHFGKRLGARDITIFGSHVGPHILNIEYFEVYEGI